MNLEVLRKTGLSDGEIKVYGALLEIGATSINKIHEKIGIDRRNIYDILNKLTEKGLVTYSETNGKRTFKLSSPEKLLSFIEEKRTHLEDVKKEVELIIPAMKEILKIDKQEMFASIFNGSEGLKAVWDDMLNYDSIYWIGSGMYVPDRFPAYWKDWNKRRLEKGVQSYHLFRDEKRKDVKKNMMTSCKFLPVEFSGNPVVIVMYGNKVAQMLLGENIRVFVIESKDLFENYKSYYDFLNDNVAKK